MLRTKTKFKTGGKVRWRILPGFACAALLFLSYAMLCPMQTPSASAVDEVQLSAFLSPSITLSMAASVNENIEPTVSGAFKNLATVARVQVMNSEYYDISISGNPDMAGTTNPEAKIAAIAGQQTAANFAANTWGYAASKNNAGVTTAVAANASTVYKPVPNTNTQVVSRQSTTNNAADDYYSLNFGAKVDTSIPADTYTSRVTLSVVASPVQATEYSLTYNANNGTGGPAKQTASSYDASYEFTVASEAPTRSGYTFLGWADTTNASSAAYTSGSKITVSETAPNKTIYAVWVANTSYSVTYFANGGTGTVPTAQTASNANATHDFTVSGKGSLAKTGYTFQGWATSEARANAGNVDYAAGATITLQKASPTASLHAVWKAIFSGITTTQGLTTTICKSATVGDTTRLEDARDNKLYWVAKLPDGNCWTTQNMSYEINDKKTTIGTVHSSDDGYFWENGLKVMNTPSASATTTIDDGWTASNDIDFYTKNGNSAVNVTSKTYDAHYLMGNYYQFSAAPTVCTGMGSQWNVPTSNQADTVNGSFNKLVKESGQNSSSDSWIMVKPYFFPRSGSVAGYNMSLSSVGGGGYYWSSTPNSSSYGYNLSFGPATGVNPSSNSQYNLYYYGYSVRCYVNGN